MVFLKDLRNASTVSSFCVVLMELNEIFGVPIVFSRFCDGFFYVFYLFVFDFLCFMFRVFERTRRMMLQCQFDGGFVIPSLWGGRVSFILF